jgi:hypothetical protein
VTQSIPTYQLLPLSNIPLRSEALFSLTRSNTVASDKALARDPRLESLMFFTRSGVRNSAFPKSMNMKDASSGLTDGSEMKMCRGSRSKWTTPYP